MKTRGLHDRKGELFAYLEGDVLYTLDGEATGRIEGSYIVDMAGNRIWQIEGDALFAPESGEAVGYFGSHSPGGS